MEFSNGKLAIKQFPLPLRHIDTTMVVFQENRKLSNIGM
jgi:hypothetical protein